MSLRMMLVVPALFACGAGTTGGRTAATAASQTPSVAFKGEECHAVWQRPKDAAGHDLPWDSAEGPSGGAWVKGDAIHDGPKEKQVIEAICFDTLAHEHTLERYLRTDDRRFDPNEAALLVDECVESGRCTSDEMMAGTVAWYAHELELTRLSAASKKLEVSQEARDAFVDRSLHDVKMLDAYLATLTPAVRAYAVDLPKAVHDARATYYKANADEYATLDRVLERLEGASPSLFTIRSDAAVRCGDALKCSFDPLYREATRWLVRADDASKMPLESRAAALSLGRVHARRGTIQAQVWASQLAYRKLHPEMKMPLAVTEEDGAAETNDPSIEVVRGEVATITPAHGTAKLTLKDPAPWKRCDDGEIDGFEGAIELTHVLYKRSCAESAPGPKVAPFNVTSIEVAGVKPGNVVVAAVGSAAGARRGILAQVLAGEQIVQLGPDKFTAASGDPLKAQP